MYRVYNSLNQLWKVYNGTSDTDPILQEFIYHPTEERILAKKTYWNDGSTRETVYYIDENFVRVNNASGNFDYTYVKHEGQLVGQLNPDNSKYFVHGDHLGSSTVVTDESQVPIENTSYSPYGEIVSGGETSRFDYEGKEFDSVMGDYDFNFRKYKAEWAIFTQPDSLISDVYDPQTLNKYSFELNNPYKYSDGDGHIADCVVGCPVTLPTAVFLYAILSGTALAVVYTGINHFFSGESNMGSSQHYATQYASYYYQGEVSYDYYYAYATEVDAWLRIAQDIEQSRAKKTKDVMDTIKTIKDLKDMLDAEDEKDEEQRSKKLCPGCRVVPIIDLNGNIVSTTILNNKGQGTSSGGGGNVEPKYVKDDGTVVWGPVDPSPDPPPTPPPTPNDSG